MDAPFIDWEQEVVTACLQFLDTQRGSVERVQQGRYLQAVLHLWFKTSDDLLVSKEETTTERVNTACRSAEAATRSSSTCSQAEAATGNLQPRAVWLRQQQKKSVAACRETESATTTQSPCSEKKTATKKGTASVATNSLQQNKA